MTLETTTKLAKHICRLLKVTDVTFPIGRTQKGNLGLCFNVNNDDYQIMLDSIPLPTESMLDDENNIELKRMVEKYWFETPILGIGGSNTVSIETVSHAKDEIVKKIGRPKKVTHGEKTK